MVADGHTGDTASDHYHRYKDDVRLMRELGLRAYRFSVAWPRIQPSGSGPVNAAGLDFYERLVDELLAADVSPYVTLYHWDLPQVLEDLGGWTNRDTAYRFADYAHAVHERLGDRVGTWMTVNEPWVAAFLGYGIGVHAPGRTSPEDAFRASHHLLLAHGLGARALREAGAQEIALTLNLAPVVTPGQLNDPELVLSAEDAEAVDRVDCLLNRQFLDPALRGSYPDPVLTIVDRIAGLGHIHDGDLDAIGQPIDLLGINYYTPCVVQSGPRRAVQPGLPRDRGHPVQRRLRPDDRHGLADRPDRPLPAARTAHARLPRGRPARHRERSRVRRCGDGRARARRRQDRLPRKPPAGRTRRHRNRDETSADTSSGRCWTTSSGRRATTGASGSCTSTSAPSGDCPRTARCGIAT